MTDKELVSKIYKHLMQLSIQKIKNPIKKWAEDLNRHSEEYIQMATRYMKRCSALLIIRKMKLKTTMRYHFTPVQLAIIKKSTNSKYWWGCGRKGTLLRCLPSQVVPVVKNSPVSTRDTRDAGSIPQLGKSPGIGNGTPLQYSCRGEFPGLRRLVGYSPGGCRESNTTERLSTRFYTVGRNVS